MTKQVEDYFLYRGRRCILAGISEGRLFHPRDVGLKPNSAGTGCARGHVCVYAILDGSLVVKSLHLHIRGVVVTREDVPPSDELHDERLYAYFNHHINEFNSALTYTGHLLVAENCIGPYRHMGFAPPWKYETVTELSFRDGKLYREVDRTSEMHEIRKKQLRISRLPWIARLFYPRESVRNAYDRTYPHKD